MADKKVTRNIWVADNTWSIIYRHNTLFHSISFHTASWWNLTSQLSHKLLGTFTSYTPLLYKIFEFLKAETKYLSSPILPVSKSSNACQLHNHQMPWFTQTVRTAHLQGYGIDLITAFYYYLNSHDRKGNQEGWEFKAVPFFTQEARVSDCLNIYFCTKKHLSCLLFPATQHPCQQRIPGFWERLTLKVSRRWPVVGRNSRLP